MKINKNTKISELINANKAAIEAIASVAPPFKRLKNPILRKIMAPRATLAEAAGMGGCTIDDLVAVLKPLGFEYEATGMTGEAQQPRPEWLVAISPPQITRLDVRPVIDQGTDPLKEILGAFGKVPAGDALCIVNSFIPTPLIHLLKQQGKAADSYVETVGEGEFHTYFLKKSPDDSPGAPAVAERVIMDDNASFQVALSRFPEGKIREIDVRDLQMPLPMQTILGELDGLHAGYALYVHHKRVPVYLLEELSGKGYEIHLLNVDDHNVKMILFK